MHTKTIYSPVFLFLILLIGVEFFVRLPFVLLTLNAPSSGHVDQLHFFSIYRANDVITLGMMLVSIALVVVLATSLVTPARIRAPATRDIPNVPASIYLICLVVWSASAMAILSLGVDALLTSFSSKRADLGERGVLWVLVKIGNFNHILILLLYLRYLKYGRRTDQIFMAISFLALAALSTVFSQRALLISLVLGLLYVSVLYGKLRWRTILVAVLSVAVVVLLISAFRPGTQLETASEVAQEGMRRAMRARYFFDFAKLGTVLHWADGEPWLGPAVIGFIFEPFVGQQVTFYKEIGPMISDQVYLYRGKNGVTPGLLLESILSFGYVFGFLFFGFVIQVFRWIEWRLFSPSTTTLIGTMVPIVILSKLSLALNSSLGAFAFQLVLEMIMLVAALFVMKLLSAQRRNMSGPRHVVRGIAP